MYLGPRGLTPPKRELNVTTELVFQVADIRFANTETGWCAVRTTDGDSVSGKFKPAVGRVFRATGKWEKHPTYGPQFKVDMAQAEMPKTPSALGRFLASQVAGIGPGTVSILVEELGDKLERCLDTMDLATLTDCIGARKAEVLLEAWPKIKPAADLVSPLLGYGLTEAMAETLVNAYGNRALEKVEKDPYSLILEVDGVSFLTADRIAMKVGKIGKKDPIRLRAAISTGMRDATSNGDIGVRHKTLIDKSMLLVNPTETVGNKKKLTDVIDVPKATLEDTLTKMLVDTKDGFASRLVEYCDEKGEQVVWYAPLVEAEQAIARRLTKFDAPSRKDLAPMVATLAARSGMKLAPEQEAAVQMVLENPASIITGGPGCGKSAVLKVVLAALDAAGAKGFLAAPTGKAAKRITESTGRPAQTLHSLLGIRPGSDCEYHESNPLPADYLVIDEASMVDTELMAYTLKALRNGCRLIIVGDVDQLPSVGPGQVLRDLIRARVLPVTRLTKVFRQGAGSGIVVAAKEINSGKVPDSTDDGQFVVVSTPSPAEALLEAMQKLIASGVNPDDIQILSPTHRGNAGCTELNKAVQAVLNPETSASKKGQRLRRDSGDIRVSDRVIQNKNDKDLGLVNGDIGFVEAIDSGNGQVQLGLPDKKLPVQMPADKTLNLKLAYAITVHKSQGAEAPYVLIALEPGAAFMLRRNLVYTAVTRASKQAMIFSPTATLAQAVHRGEPEEGSRRTSLVAKLHAMFPSKVKAEPSLADIMLVDAGDDCPF